MEMNKEPVAVPKAGESDAVAGEQWGKETPRLPEAGECVPETAGIVNRLRAVTGQFLLTVTEKLSGVGNGQKEPPPPMESLPPEMVAPEPKRDLNGYDGGPPPVCEAYDAGHGSKRNGRRAKRPVKEWL